MPIPVNVSPFNCYESLDRIVAGGFRRLSEEDQIFLRSIGIFLKKDRHFMVRLRLRAGNLSRQQAQKIGELAKQYGDDYLDFTTRQEIELRYIELANLTVLLRELESVGISTSQTGGNSIRTITSSSFNALGKAHIIDVFPLIEEIEQEILNEAYWMENLPSKFNLSLLGTSINDCNIYGNDCAFVVAQQHEIIGFKLYLGGAVGRQAEDSGLFVPPQKVVKTFWAVITCFGHLAKKGERLHQLLERVGMEYFLFSLQSEITLESGGGSKVLAVEEYRIDETGLLPMDEELSMVHLSVPSGLFSGSCLMELAGEATKHNAKIRISLEQSIYLLVDPEEVASLKSSLIYRIYEPYHHLYYNHQIACTSAETVAFSVLPNKTDAIALSNFLQQKVPIPNAKVRLYWSSSPKGYGLHDIADIGFVGISQEGSKERRLNLYLGGKVTHEAKVGRLIFEGITLEEAKVYVKRIMELYRDQRLGDESFESFDSRVLGSLSVEEIRKILT